MSISRRAAESCLEQSAEVLFEKSYGLMNSVLLREKTRSSSIDCLEKRFSADRSHAYDRDSQAVSVKSRNIGGDCCSDLKNYERVANKTRVFRTEDCDMHEQRGFAGRDAAAKRKILSSLVLVRSNEDDGEEISEARVLLFCRCIVKVDTKGVELTSVQYMECVLSLDAADEKLEFVDLRWARKDGGKN